jgi:hypothetical protein
MNKIKISVIIMLLLIISNCYDFIGVSHEVPLENHTGNWLFAGSVYSESSPFDSVG